MKDYSYREASEACTDPELRDLVLFYLNDDVTPAQRRAVEEHLPRCQACQHELRFFAAAQQAWKEKSRRPRGPLVPFHRT